MALPPFQQLAFQDKEALSSLPEVPGVVELIGRAETRLLVGRPANIRRWASSRLSRRRPSRPGGRPPLDLTPITTEIRYCATRSAFEQRLVFERLVSQGPRKARRDLKEPFYLHLDLAQRFPRFRVCPRGSKVESLYGPFRSRAAAEEALGEMHKRFPLRPCEYTFEPAPDLKLGLDCFFAQTRTCAAPCLCRASEEEYRALAQRSAEFLASAERESLPWVSPWVGRLQGTLGLVLIPGKVVFLYPVREGAVLEGQALEVPKAEAEGALARLVWEAPDPAPDDTAWLIEWIGRPRGPGVYHRVDERDFRDTVRRSLDD